MRQKLSEKLFKLLKDRDLIPYKHETGCAPVRSRGYAWSWSTIPGCVFGCYQTMKTVVEHLEKGLPIDTSTHYCQTTLWLRGLDYEVKPQIEGES